MLSNLGPLFKTVFRQAESADARLEIRREEKENSGKKKDHEEDAGTDDALWQDSTGVSVGALRTFLIEFLKSHGAPAEQVIVPDMAPSENSAGQKPAVSAVAARAVKAYTSMTAATAYTPPQIQAETPPAAPVDEASLLRADEIRSIHTLIADLDTLAKEGVETLTIQMNGGTFLESLTEAVRLVKANR